jgi:hypothetical protein
MGTRADYYVGIGPNAEWLGSTAWDGYPDGAPASVLGAQGEADFRARVTELLQGRDDATLPEQGWPWPWKDSRTTDYAYAWHPERGIVVSVFGREWHTVAEVKAFDDDDDVEWPKLTSKDVPNMAARQNVTLGRRSGILSMGVRPRDEK